MQKLLLLALLFGFITVIAPAGENVGVYNQATTPQNHETLNLEISELNKLKRNLKLKKNLSINLKKVKKDEKESYRKKILYQNERVKGAQRQIDSLIEQMKFKQTQSLKRSNDTILPPESDSCSKDDSLALVTFYQEMNGSNWEHQENWLSNKPVKDWWGIIVRDNRVRNINFYWHNDSSQNVSGTFSDALWELTGLESLDLSKNNISDTIPKEIGNLTRLDSLSFYDNDITGNIPPEIGNLNWLRMLWLDRNQLSGTIPPSLGNLNHLRDLWLYDNQLTGNIPAELGDLKRIRILALGKNNLTGNIPYQLGDLEYIEALFIDNAELTGAVPTDINKLTTLKSLHINGNFLDVLPLMDNLGNLLYLHVENNLFDFGDLEHCGIHPNALSIFEYAPQAQLPEPTATYDSNKINLSVNTGASNNKYYWFRDGQPADTTDENHTTLVNEEHHHYHCEIKNPTYPQLTLETASLYSKLFKYGVLEKDYLALKELYDSTNGDQWKDNTNWLKDTLVNEWYGVSVSDQRVVVLELPDNNLSGIIPTEIGDLTELRNLYLENNSLSGNIPKDIGKLTKVQYLYMQNNNLSGSIPDEMGNMSTVFLIYLSNNNLEGGIPTSFNNLPNCMGIFASGNNLSSLPYLGDMGSDYTGVNYLYFGNNSFTFGDLERTGFKDGDVYRYYYDLQNPIPMKIDTSSNSVLLSVLAESPNNTYQWYKGNEKITNATDSIYSYAVSDTNSYYCKVNNSDYPDLTLKTAAVGQNLVNGVRQQEYDALLSLYNSTNGDNWVNNMNWKSEKPVGEWNGITTEGAHVSKIDMYQNNLSGTIPGDIDQFKELFMLNLWGNNITGNIPSEISELSNLFHLYLPENNLTGTIPSSLGNMDSLRRLYLHYNQLTGSIPKELASPDSLTYLALHGNQLTGTVPAELNNISNLLYFGIYDNKLDSLPPLPSFSNLDYCLIQNNHFNFNDIENSAIDWSSIPNHTYGPQKPVTVSQTELTVNLGDSLKLDIFQLISQQTGAKKYQWVKGEDTLNTSALFKTKMLMKDTGYYVCEMINDNYPELVLTSDSIKVLHDIKMEEILLSDTTILENLSADTIMGILKLPYMDTSETYTFKLVNGDGSNDADNGKFSIKGDTLKAQAVFNFEEENKLNIYIQCSNSAGESCKDALDIKVLDMNEMPTGIILSNDSITKDTEPGSVIGVFKTIDEDINDQYTYKLVEKSDTSNLDNVSFEIDQDSLKSALDLDIEIKEEYDIYVQTTDSAGNTFSKSFTIKISDVVNDNTGIANWKGSGFRLYPNPTKGNITLSGPAHHAKHALVKISDLNGKIVYQKTFKKSKLQETINLNHLPNGIYIFYMVINNNLYVKKMIIN